jgi:hypothetical protein
MKKTKITHSAETARILRFLLFRLSVFALAVNSVSSNSVATPIRTEVKGMVTLNITSGTGQVKRTTLVSAPLLNEDPDIISRGSVVRVSSKNSVEIQPIPASPSGVLAQGYLARPQHPFLLMLTSGSSSGSVFLITGNKPETSATTLLTIRDPNDSSMDLTTLGIQPGDKYRLLTGDTLLSLFGTPSTTGVVGGSNPREADNVVLVSNGTATTHYYNTTMDRWTRVGLGSPDSGNTPILPYYGAQYSRVGSAPMKINLYGEVPYTPRRLKIRSQGITLLSSYWPATISLAQSGLEQVPGWRFSENLSPADRVVMVNEGQAFTYIHDTLGWKKLSVGRPDSSHIGIPPASALMISRSAAGTPSLLIQAVPYSR